MTRLRLSPVRVVRQQLGIGQATLARYLGVSRELVTQVEAARRTLPPAADRKLTALLALLPAPIGAAPVAAAKAPSAAETVALAAALRARLRDCRHQAAGLQWQLEQLQRRATAARQCLLVVPPLLAALPPAPTTTGATTAEAEATAAHDRLWLEILAAEATAALEVCGAPAQALLTLRLTALEFEVAEVERQLGALPDGA